VSNSRTRAKAMMSESVAPMTS